MNTFISLASTLGVMWVAALVSACGSDAAVGPNGAPNPATGQGAGTMAAGAGGSSSVTAAAGSGLAGGPGTGGAAGRSGGGSAGGGGNPDGGGNATGISDAGLPDDGFASALTEWPNAVSHASSDTWLSVHHADIQKLRPRVLVLNFDDTRDNATVSLIVNAEVAGLREGSRPRGYLDATAQPMLEYQIDKIVDLADHPPPPGWTKKTSSIYPRRADVSGFNWGTDYAQLFNSNFAARYGYADPEHPGQFLSLCQLSDMGLIHDVWMVFEPDDGDVSAAEILEWAPIYDQNRAKTTDWNPCAGNGCFDSDVPHCAGSLRIGFINASRGPGCFIHGEGHGMEHKLGEGLSIPSVAPYFKEFADFDLDTRHGLPFPNWYFLPADNPDPPEPNSPCDYIKWTSASSIEWTNVPKPAVCTTEVPRTPLNPYVPVCGSVHFAPNARRHYDDFNTFVVLSTCQGWRRHEGTGGSDLARGFSNATFAQYNQLAQDCEGGFQVWWRQNVPGRDSGIVDNENHPMLSWWPYLFY